ncbi:glycosyltransferase [Corynebacterium poyangense]|uniref:Glycosyltransferase n=1 Tax=Corynebacterium poyangense TaxID=2684405 RepID=A0A7H0SLX7_9CORY|nr:glycosyltransferase family 1 protein [Corynebacterium poyangense]MBZ8177660.1 glycosyltransferase [Corynebacterium poyangense]QNQ89552.1 glycosyltransferase [Corynebacterium poyangense]
MRVAIIAESFLPNVNGVSNSVLRVLEHLAECGHEAMVIAPGARGHAEEIPNYVGFNIRRVPTIRVPLIDSLPVGVPTVAVRQGLKTFQPDIVHLASPFVLGAAGAFAAKQLKIPSVAVYQTDIAGFSRRYRLSALATASWDWIRAVHNRCQLTLAPSSVAIGELEDHGVEGVRRWGRGVDSQRFHPRFRDPVLRRHWNPTGKKIILGYVGRLAAEKGVHRLAKAAQDPRIQVIIVGDGPERVALTELMPGALFTGALTGQQLARAYASFDLFAHPGEFETFCQTIQEAQASGVPTIGPHAGGPIDLISEGINGSLLPVADFHSQLPATVHRLMSPGLYPRLQAQARAGVAERTWQALGDQLLSYYEDAVELAKIGDYGQGRFK